MDQKYKENGWISWYDPSVLERFVVSLREYLPDNAIGVKAEGFSPPV
jgi:hypothetical protein